MTKSNIEKQEQRARWIALGWFYDQGGQLWGPFSSVDIKRQVSAGEIAPHVPAYVGWQRGDEVRYLETELKYALGAADKPAPAKTDHGPTSASSCPTIADQEMDTAKDEERP